MGCMQKVFEAEIDVDDAARARSGRARASAPCGAMRGPLPMCHSEVDPCFCIAPASSAASTRSSTSCRRIADVPRVRAGLGLASRDRAERSTPMHGPDGARARTRAATSARRDRRERRRSAGDDDAEQRLLEAERGAAARGARGLRGRREREPVPRHARAPPATTSAGMSSASGASTSGGDDAGRDRERDADQPHRPQPRCASAVGPAARARCARRSPSTLIAARTRCRRSRRDAAMLVEEQDDEARDRDLRDEVERRAAAEQPHARVAHRRRRRRRAPAPACRRAADEDAATTAPPTHAAAERDEREARAAGRREPRQPRRRRPRRRSGSPSGGCRARARAGRRGTSP